MSSINGNELQKLGKGPSTGAAIILITGLD